MPEDAGQVAVRGGRVWSRGRRSRRLSLAVALAITVCAGLLPAASAQALTFGPFQRGYLLAGADGGVFAFGALPFEGSLANTHLAAPIVAILPNVVSVSHGSAVDRAFGYLLVGRDGRVYPIGMKSHGDLAAVHLRAPIVGATIDGLGYDLADAAGDVFRFVGTGSYQETAGPNGLRAPIVGIAYRPLGGYWLVDAAGDVYAYGGAPFFGDLRAGHPSAPIVGMVEDNNHAGSDGYVLAGADGSVYAFGHAEYDGDLHGQHLNAPIVGVSNLDDHGYYLTGKDGGVFAFGDGRKDGDGVRFSPFLGSMGGQHLNAPVVATAAVGFSNRTS